MCGDYSAIKLLSVLKYTEPILALQSMFSSHIL